jgi:hypothetical protein
MGKKMDAEKLVRKAKKGNKQAFLQLIEAEQTRLYRMVLS